MCWRLEGFFHNEESSCAGRNEFYVYEPTVFKGNGGNTLEGRGVGRGANGIIIKYFMMGNYKRKFSHSIFRTRRSDHVIRRKLRTLG